MKSTADVGTITPTSLTDEEEAGKSSHREGLGLWEPNAPSPFVFEKQIPLLVKGFLLPIFFIDRMKTESIWLFFCIPNAYRASLLATTAPPAAAAAAAAAAAIFRIHARSNAVREETRTWNKREGDVSRDRAGPARDTLRGE